MHQLSIITSLPDCIATRGASTCKQHNVLTPCPSTAPVCVSSSCSVSVVAEFNQYWVKLPGPVISQRGAPPLTTQWPTGTPPVEPSTTPSILPGPVSFPFISFKHHRHRSL